MEVIKIPKPKQDVNQVGGIWTIDISIPTETISAAYLLPINPIFAIGLEWDGVGLNPAIEFTFGSEEEIIADTAVWTVWNKTAIINLAITAIRFENKSLSTVATAKIIVKGNV